MADMKQWEYRVLTIGRFWGTKDGQIEETLCDALAQVRRTSGG